MLTEKDALIVVDVQVDFCPGGSLAVKNANSIIPIINSLIKIFLDKNLPIIFSRDWHPADHCSFKESGGTWPIHCVQNTKGAMFHPDLLVPQDAIIISKAQEKDKEAYSTFQDTLLAEKLKELKVKRTFICGLATDFCVKETAIDSSKIGFETFVIIDATKAVFPEKLEETLKELTKNNIKIITSKDII